MAISNQFIRLSRIVSIVLNLSACAVKQPYLEFIEEVDSKPKTTGKYLLPETSNTLVFKVKATEDHYQEVELVESGKLYSMVNLTNPLLRALALTATLTILFYF